MPARDSWITRARPGQARLDAESPAGSQSGQVAVGSPPGAPSQTLGEGEPAGGSSGPALGWRRWLRSPIVLAIIACAALAALSAAVLPTVPSYDPWSWIVWGREVVDPHLSFTVAGGPSWKPLPVIFTTVFALFGGAAPTLWVITARAGGLLALVAAWRLASRLTGGQRAGAFAGLIAAAGVLLTQDWFYYMFRGTSEPILVGASLWAIDRLLDGRRGQAFVLGVAGSLIRPEWWPFIGLYGLWLWFKEPRLRVLVIAGLLSIPVFWFVPPWIGSGQPFLAATHAKDYNGHLGANRLLEVLRRGVDLQVLPALIAGLAAVAIAWFKDRDRITLVLAGGVLAWWALVVGMTLDGYPGLERFYLPAAGVTCVLGGVGIVRLAVLAGDFAGARAVRFGGGPRAVTVAAALLLLVISIPLTTSRISAARAAKPAADTAVKILDQLSSAVAAAGGHAGVFPCKSSFAAVNHGVQTALAWKLHVTLSRVGTSMREPGVDFVGPHNGTDGSPAAVDPRLTNRQPVAQSGVWRIVRLTDPRLPASCVGR